MLTASITLSQKRNSTPFSAFSINYVCRNFKSEVLICRGSSKSFDTKSIAQLQEFAAEKSPDIEIMVNGNDELNVAGALIDYFNHGLGI
jgi:phosphotransferase system HPr-like phosphotransfer protein